MLTTLDPDVALLCVDLQAGILRLPTNVDAHLVASRVGTVARAFREHGKPVVVVTVGGTPSGRTEQGRKVTGLPDDFTEPAAALDQQPGDITVRKSAWGAFTGTDLHHRLAQRGTTQLVVCGISTSIGVESTARVAFDLGYHVVVPTDMVADTSAEAHANSLERIFPRMAERTTSGELLTALAAQPPDAERFAPR